MKKTTLLLGILLTTAFAFTSCSSTETAETSTTEENSVIADGSYAINTDASLVGWKGSIIGGVKSHEGTLDLTSASVDVSNGAITGGAFEVDLTSMTPTDDAYDDEDHTKAKLVSHLSSDDFFNVAEFPTAAFTITGSEGDKVMGNLTVRGITHPEVVENVVIMEENGSSVMTGDLTFDRSQYEVNFEFIGGDLVLSNDIELTVKLVAAQ